MPQTTDILQAPTLIRSLARPRGPHSPVVVGITGPVGAGKSYLAALLSSCVISTDHYLPDYDQTPEPERDLPERSDLTRLHTNLRTLKRGLPAVIPNWSFHTHSRIGQTPIHPAELIVVEGLHALHDTHAAALDVRVYIDAPSAVRWSRWEHLERTGVRGWGVEVAREFFHKVAEPTFGARAKDYRTAAHVVIHNHG
ncbi:MAG: hypothetical protein K2W85_08155 [Phycisphaerales bacterium]|nr:hypothetical protein [Phycisphaerales bacterium]